MSSLTTFAAKVKQTVKDTANRFTDAEIKNFITQAVRQYSRDKPRRMDDVLTGDGTAQEFAVPTGWQDGFSIILFAEYPVDNVPPTYLDVADNVKIVRKSNVDKIQTFTLTLQNTKTARVGFTALHTVDVTSSTVLTQDEDAVADLASSFFARALAAFYAESSEPSLTQDVVDYIGKAERFNATADKLFGQYQEHISGGELVTPALSHGDIDIRSNRYRDLLLHPRRER